VEPIASLQKCFCYGWCLHDEYRKSKPVYFVYGFYSKGGKVCGGRNAEGEFVRRKIAADSQIRFEKENCRRFAD